MSFSVPTFAQIRDRMLADVDASLAADGSTRGPVEYALVTAFAGASLLLHTAVARAARNHVPTRAEPWVMRLWASFFGVTPKPATYNFGTVRFFAIGGAVLPEGTILRLRNGVELSVDVDTPEMSGWIIAFVTAVRPGPAGRASPGTPIFLSQPVSGVNSQGIVFDGIGGGVDEESDASLLSRLVDRLRDPPKGGTEADYVRWAKATPGVDVADVWVYPNALGPSSVKLLFTLGADDPIPTIGPRTLVAAYVQPFVPVDVMTFAVGELGRLDMNPEIALSPNDPTTRDAVVASLRALLVQRAEPGGTILLSQINEAISIAAGENDHVLVSPVSNVVPGIDQLVTLGTPIFTTL